MLKNVEARAVETREVCTWRDVEKDRARARERGRGVHILRWERDANECERHACIVGESRDRKRERERRVGANRLRWKERGKECEKYADMYAYRE